MLYTIFKPVINFRIREDMDQAFVNQVQRINLLYLVISPMLLIAASWGLSQGNYSILLINGITFLILVTSFFLFPAAHKTNLSATILSAICGLLVLLSFTFNNGLYGSILVAFYLLYPFASVIIVESRKMLFPLILGLLTLAINYFPLGMPGVHLEGYNALVFFIAYAIVLLVSMYIDRGNMQYLAQTKEAKERYEAQVQEKDAFISRLSHGLRTSLSNIQLINNLVHDGRLSSEQKELLETLRASTNSLIEHVNNIVEIASPGNVDYKKSIVSFDLCKVIEEALGILDTSEADHPVNISKKGQLSHYLIGDPSLVRGLVVNTCKGLRRYLPEGKAIRLFIDNLQETASEVRIEFGFRFESPREKELFNYLDTLNRGGDISSSGLAVAHKLLREMESKLTIKNEGSDSLVSFCLDFTRDLTKVVQEESQSGQADETEESPVDLKDAEVLLVEDNDINQKIVILSLRKHVSKIDVAPNGKVALEMFGSKQYDLILMDIMMPVMDGITATKKIREIESTGGKHVPIIAITANALAGDRDNCLAAGVDEYIAKPFHTETLIEMMQNLLA